MYRVPYLINHNPIESLPLLASGQSMSLLRKICCCGLVLGSVLLLTSCDRTTPEEHYENARGYFAAKQIRTAVIELKNALQKAPDFADARFLLGESHAKLGDFPSALKEYERSLDLGQDTEEVKVGLLKAKVRLGRHQEVIGELEGTGSLSPPLAVVLGDAYLSGEDVDRAKALYQQGLTLADGNLGLAIIALRQGDLQGAKSYLQDAIRIDPDHRESWVRQGELALAETNWAGAIAAFAIVRDLPGGEVLGRVGLARVHIAEHDHVAAAEEIAHVLRLAPQFPLGHYLDALVKFQELDTGGAEAALREVQRSVPDHGPSLYLMGVVKYQQKQFSQAKANLQRFLARNATNESARKLLATIYFEEENFAEVIEILKPIMSLTRDPQVYALVGSCEMRLGHPAKAATALERAVELAPDMAPFRNQLALSLLSAGEDKQAEAMLASAIEVDQDQFQSDYLIAMMRLRERDFAAAGEAVEAIIVKSPDNPLGYNLRGAVALGLGDASAAKTAFSDALDRDPEFLPAVSNLVRLAQQVDDVTLAESYYQDLLNRVPEHEDALMGMAELAVKRANVDGAVTYLQQAIAGNPESVRARLGLLRLYLLQNEVEKADRLADQALAIVPNHPDLLVLRVQVDLRKGDVAAARSGVDELQAMTASQQDNVRFRFAVGQLQSQVGNQTLARSNFDHVLELTDQQHVGALRGLLRLDLRDTATPRAAERLQQLSTLGDGGSGYDLLTADVLAAQGKTTEAVEAYKTLARNDVRDGAMRLALIRLQTGDWTEAAGGLRVWLTRHEYDLGAQLLLADSLMRGPDKSAAISLYESLQGTNNPVVLNNLAWLYMERGDARAVGMARRANEVTPNHPDIADTLGWILVRNGDLGSGLDYLKQSVQLNPNNPSVQYHLGVAFAEQNQSTSARGAFAKALSMGDFPEAAQVRDAMARLVD